MTVCNDPWIYARDDAAEDRRIFQCYMYIVATNHPQTNHYSLPCTSSPVFDAITKEHVRMDYLPTRADHSTHETRPWRPVQPIEYAPELLQRPLRDDLMPYTVQQPRGASFHVDGQLVSWQKWKFRANGSSGSGLTAAMALCSTTSLSTAATSSTGWHCSR